MFRPRQDNGESVKLLTHDREVIIVSQEKSISSFDIVFTTDHSGEKNVRKTQEFLGYGWW